jgi:hypothetical protein
LIPIGKARKKKNLKMIYDAISYARNNCSRYPEYQVIDLNDDSVVDSDKMAQDEEDASWGMMFPEGTDD